MDEGQSGQQGGEKKAQLSWSQPLTTPAQKPVQTTTPQTPSQTKKNETTNTSSNHTTRNLIIGIIILLVIAGGIWAFVAGNKTSTPSVSTGTVATSTGSTTTTPTGSTAALPDESLVITSPQSAGLGVSVSRVVVSVPTWIVIYENYNGQPGNALGAALFVSGRESGVVDLLRGTLPGQTYFAGKARDDGDHMFSMVRDSMIRDAEGNPVLVKFETK